MNTELAVEERLRRLESQVRRARMWSVATTVALGAVVFVSMQVPQAKELNVDKITARQFTLVDEAGHLRGSFGPDGRWGAEESAVSLTLLGPSMVSNSRVYVRAGLSGSEIQLSDSWHNTGAWMEAGQERAGFRAGSAPKGATGVTSVNASLLSEAGEGRLELRRELLDVELSKEGKTALVNQRGLVIIPVNGLVEK